MIVKTTNPKFLAVKRIGRIIEPRPHFLSWTEAKQALGFIQNEEVSQTFLDEFRKLAAEAFDIDRFVEIERSSKPFKTARDRGFVFRSKILEFKVGEIDVAISFSFTICMELALQSKEGAEKSKSKLWFSCHFSSEHPLVGSNEFQKLLKIFDKLAEVSGEPIRLLYEKSLSENFAESISEVCFLGNQFEVLTFQEEDDDFLQNLAEIETKAKSALDFEIGALSFFSRVSKEEQIKSFAAESLFGAARTAKGYKIEAQVCSDYDGVKAYYVKATTSPKDNSNAKIRYLGVTSGTLSSLVDQSMQAAQIPLLAQPASVISAALVSQIGSGY